MDELVKGKGFFRADEVVPSATGSSNVDVIKPETPNANVVYLP